MGDQVHQHDQQHDKCYRVMLWMGVVRGCRGGALLYMKESNRWGQVDEATHLLRKEGLLSFSDSRQSCF